MVRQINVLQELKRPPKPLKRAIKVINSNLVVGCNDCRHALSLSHGVYCALRREKLDRDACDGCPYFDPEPLEYRLFRRR